MAGLIDYKDSLQTCSIDIEKITTIQESGIDTTTIVRLLCGKVIWLSVDYTELQKIIHKAKNTKKYEIYKLRG